VKLVVHRSEVAVPPPKPVEEADPIAAFTSESDPPTSAPTKAKQGWRLPSVPKMVGQAWRGPSGRMVRRGAIVLLSVAILAVGGYVALLNLRARTAAAATPPETRLVVSSNPAGAEVLIDDVPRGVTPLDLALPVGGHKLTVRAEGFSRDVQIDARANVELVQHVEVAAPAAPSEPAAPAPEPAPRATGPAVGTLIVTSPIDVELFQGNALIGSSQTARLLLPAGRHTITAVNGDLGFNRAIQVDVAGGGTTRIPITLPNGTLSVNAQPWAEVFVNGRSLGQTPLGNVTLPIGSHDLVLRHPQLGQRSQTIIVGVGKPTRVGVDMRQ
jgi:hypothetical protein